MTENEDKLIDEIVFSEEIEKARIKDELYIRK